MPTIQVNDLTMNYIERGNGPTTIALHPATVSGAEMGWVVGVLIQEGFTAITPDQRGHGQTENPAPDLHLPRLVDDFLEFAYQLGRIPLHGIGYSMGGAVMLYAAARKPDLFRSLIVMGSNWRPPEPERVRRVVGPEEARPDLVRKVFDLETGISKGWDAPLETFKSIICPTLVMCADRDEFYDVEDNVELYKMIPNAELLVMPRCGHFEIVRNTHVMAAMREFYGRVPHQ